jgi:molybdenum cofactor synthesis domain-containing protein
VLREEHVDLMKKAGHYYVFVEEEVPEGVVWEDEATLAVGKAVAGGNVKVEKAGEGSSRLVSVGEGVLVVDDNLLDAVNSRGDFLVITRRSFTKVGKGDVVAVVELVPLYVSRSRIDEIARLVSARPVISVVRPRPLKAGLVVTGTEVYEGRVRDLVGDKVRDKLREYWCELSEKVIVPDDEKRIRDAVVGMASRYDLVVVSGGMSVDPTDLTPKAIVSAGAKLVAYGIPIKPNTMSLLAYLDDKPVIGVPSSIIYYRDYNVLDVLLPRIVAGRKLTKSDLMSLAHGGLSDAYLKKQHSH